MMLAERPRPEFTLEPNIGEDPFNGCAGVRGRIDHRFLAASAFSPCNHRRNSADFIETAHFLRSCFLCMRRLGHGCDIYMYRGDRAFCSKKCRNEQMIQDECSFASKKEAPLAASEGVTVALKGRGSRKSMPKSHISYLLDEVCEEIPCVNSDFASCKEPDCKINEDNGKAVKYCTGNCKQNPNPNSTLESSSRDGFKELGMEPENKGIISDFLSFVGRKESYKSKGKSWTRFYFLYDPRRTERWKSLIAAMANYLEFNIYNLDLTSLSSLSDLTNKLASIMNRSLILIQDFDHCAGMLSDLNATELTGPCLLEFVNGLLLSCGDERIIVFTTNNRDLHAAALHAAALRHPFNKDIYIHKSSPPPVALPDEGEIVQLDSSKQNETEAAASSFKWAFQLEGLTTQSTAYPNPSILVFPQLEIASTEVLSENMESSKDGRNLLASQQEFFLEGHISKSSNLAFPACSDAAAPSQLVATILHTSPAIPHMIPNLTGGSSKTFQLGGQSTQSTAYPNHNFLVFPQPQIALTQIRSENMGSSEDWRASQQEPTCSGPSPSQPPMTTTPYTMHRIPHVMPPLTSSQDASSVKLKATYRDTIIEFQLPVASGIIELREEVAMILKLELDSFDVKYKDEEGEGDWILIPCDKDFRNYLQLLSSLVNPVTRLLVVDKDANLTNLDPMALKQPAMFMESGIDPDNNGIISDLLRFVSKKEIYKKAGKAWMRFYLLYEPPGADRSSLIAAMANYLEFDICHLGLRSMSSIPELKNMLLSTPNRSLIAVQDIDHCAEMLPNLKNESAIGLPDGGCMLSLSKKKIVRKTLKRKGRTMSVLSLESHQHVDNRWEDAVKSLGSIGAHAAKRVCRQPVIHHVSSANCIHRQPGIHRWPFQQNWATMKGYHLVDERLVEVISLCVDGKLVLRRRHILTSWFGRFSPRPSALPGGGGFVGPIALSSSEFAATNNRTHRVGQDQSGATASHSKKKRTREQEDREEINKSITLNDLRQHYGRKRKDAAESLGVSVSTLKRISRLHGITRWPNTIRKKVLKPPDPHGETNPSTECEKLSTNGQIEMENDPALSQPMPTIPHTMGSSYDWRSLLVSQEEPFMEGHVCGSSNWTAASCYDPALSQPLPTMPHTVGSLNDWRNLLASQEDPFLEGDVYGNINLSVASCFDPTPIQPLPTSLQTMGTSEDWSIFLPSQEEPFIEGHVSESINWTVPPCSDLDPSQPMSTTPYTMPTIPLMTPTRSMKLKAIYGDTTIKFQLPLTSGINELKEEVSKILEFEHGSFNVEYKDEDGDWILMARDENVREYLQLLTSLGNQVGKLKIRDKVPNTMNFCETCGTLKHKRP